MPNVDAITINESKNDFYFLLRFFFGLTIGCSTSRGITGIGGSSGSGGNSGCGSSISGYNASKSGRPGASGISPIISSHFSSTSLKVIGVTNVATAPEEYAASWVFDNLALLETKIIRALESVSSFRELRYVHPLLVNLV